MSRRKRLEAIVQYVMDRSPEIRAVSVGHTDELAWRHRGEEGVPKRLAAAGHAVAAHLLSSESSADEIVALRHCGLRALTCMLPGGIPIVIVVPMPSAISKSLVRIIRQLVKQLVATPVPVRDTEPTANVVRMPPSGTDDEMREQNVGLTLMLAELLGTSARSIRASAHARFDTWHERGRPPMPEGDDQQHNPDLPSYAELMTHVGALRSALQGEMTKPELERLLEATRLDSLMRGGEKESA